jgi:hypothetical protein
LSRAVGVAAFPGSWGCTALVFWRFFSGRGLAIQNHAPSPAHSRGRTLRASLRLPAPGPYGMTPPGVETPLNLAWISGGVQVKNVLRSVLPMLLVVLAMPLPAGADVTVYVAGRAVEVPVPLQLLMFGFALLSIGGLVRKWKQKSGEA